MKTTKAILASLTAMLALTSSSALTSCSDNGKDEPAAPAAKQIAGIYSGDMICTVINSSSDYKDLAFGITATDDATVTVTLPAFGEAPMAMPEIKVEGVKVSEADGTVTLATTKASGTASNGKAYTCTLEGSVKDETFNVKYNLTYGAMPMPLICSATATKQK